MSIIHLIDDEADRHVVYSRLFAALADAIPGYFSPPQSYGPLASVYEEANTKAQYSESITGISRLLDDDSSDAVLLLDLWLGRSAATKREINELLVRSQSPFAQAIRNSITDAVNASDLFADDCYTATTAASIASVRGWPIILVSRNARMEESEQFVSRFQCNTLRTLDKEKIRAFAGDRFTGTGVTNSVRCNEWLAKWYYAILDLLPHEDPRISLALMTYSKPFNGTATCPWWHGECENINARALAARAIGTGIDPPLESDETKALFMHHEPDASFEYDKPRKSVPVAFWQSAIKAIGLDAKCELVKMQLPCNPGIAFLAAIKELQNALNAQHPLPAGAFCFRSTQDGSRQSKEFSVSINLDSKANEHALHHFCSFMRKTGAGSTTLVAPAGGVSLALWNACHARLGKLRDHATGPAFSIFREGTNGFVAWPSFAENEIILRWCPR